MNNEQEVWKQIPSFPNYAASNLGRIKNIKRDRIMAQSPVDNRDYQKVCFSRNNKTYSKKVSRMVWEAFNGIECPETIDHIDGDKKNNRIDNLACISNRENCNKQNIYRNKINRYNLDDTKRKEILTKYNSGVSVWKLSFEYQVPSNYLYTTFKRGSWNHLCWNNDTGSIETSQKG